MIDFTKPVTTADGKRVHILTTEARHEAPVWGYIEDWPLSKWHLDGKLYDGGKVPECNLINSSPVKRIPLDRQSAVPGSWFRRFGFDYEYALIAVNSCGVVLPSFSDGLSHLTWNELMENGWEIWQPMNTGWLPCYHER